MNKTLKALLNQYGTEKVIARILEQLKILATSDDDEVKKTVKELVKSSGCDTEYIYSLCEFSNLVTFVSEEAMVSDFPWKEEKPKSLSRRYFRVNK